MLIVDSQIHLWQKGKMSVIGAFVVLASALTGVASDYDGEYTGYITCAAIPGQTAQSLKTDFALKIAGGKVDYQREVLRPNDTGRMGVTERGRGTVSASGEVSLSGSATGTGFSFDATYRGQVNGRTLQLEGTQLWQLPRRPAHSRACTISVARPGSSEELAHLRHDVDGAAVLAPDHRALAPRSSLRRHGAIMREVSGAGTCARSARAASAAPRPPCPPRRERARKRGDHDGGRHQVVSGVIRRAAVGVDHHGRE
jgi:hypothetical protein